jgi:hypothetical protein
MLKRLVVAALMLFPVLAFAMDGGMKDAGADMAPMAAPVMAPPMDDPMKILADGINAAKAHDWKMFAAMALIGVVYCVRRFGANVPKIGPFLSTDRGGAIAALVLSAMGGAATALFSKAPFNFTMFADSVLVAVMAAGGWNLVKKIATPSAQPPAK